MEIIRRHPPPDRQNSSSEEILLDTMPVDLPKVICMAVARGVVVPIDQLLQLIRV